MTEKKGNTFWGFFFIACGVLLIGTKLFDWDFHFSLWKIFWTIGFGMWFLKSFAKKNFYGIFFSAAFLGIVYDDFLNIEKLTPFPLLFAALLLSIGCSMAFPNAKRNKYRISCNSGTEIINEDGEVVYVPYEENKIFYEVTFSSAVNYVESSAFSNAYFSCNFGALKVYFDRATMAGDEAIVTIDNNFGGTDLYFPKEWKVINQMSTAFGGVSEKNSGNWDGIHKIVLKGDTNFGGVSIYYV